MIEIRNLTKKYGERCILVEISARIRKGEIFSIIGPSGQGKTTLLRLINLLERPSGGEILFDGFTTSQSGDIRIRRRMGMVFQKPVAFDDTVFENIAKGLRYRGIRREEIQRRVLDELGKIGLSGYEARNATSLSGGEMQRVSLARVMVTRPDLLILDEPTANLDPISASMIEDLIKYYNHEYGTTVILSTHDLLQGQRLADRIAVIMAGKIVQIGDTYEVFAHPGHPSVARFIGIQNLFPGEVIRRSEGIVTVICSGVQVQALSDISGEQVMVGIRAEDITIHTGVDTKTSARNVIPGEISAIKPFGIAAMIQTKSGSLSLQIQVTWQSVQDLELHPGKMVTLSWKASSVHLMKGEGLS